MEEQQEEAAIKHRHLHWIEQNTDQRRFRVKKEKEIH